MIKLLLALILLVLIGAAKCQLTPAIGWRQVSHKWPLQNMEYFLATARGHHFIEIKLPRDLNEGDLSVRLEYFYNYSRIRPDVRLVPCNTAIDVIENEALQPRGQWLVHQMHLTSATCSQNQILVYNILLHDEDDVFAWRYVELSIHQRKGTEVAPVDSESRNNIGSFTSFSCHPGHCAEDNFIFARFTKLNKGLPDGVFNRLNQGASVYVNTKSGSPFWLNLQAPLDGVKRDACFKLELYMDEGTEFELSLHGRHLERRQPNWFAGRWFTYKYCGADHDLWPSDKALMFQLKPNGTTSDRYMLVAHTKAAAWFEPHWQISLPGSSQDATRSGWVFSLDGGPELNHELDIRMGDQQLLVRGIDPRATSLRLRTHWITWSESDADSWFFYKARKEDWIRGIKFTWERQSHQSTEQESNDATSSAESSSSDTIKFKLEGEVGEKYRFRLLVALEEAPNAATKRELVISTLAITKDQLW